MDIYEDIAKIESSLNRLEEFHGHLGPYIIIGARMALIANELLGSDAFNKKATVYTKATPPLSCVIDGIQFFSGCTLGKGNIKIRGGPTQEIKAVFECEGKKLEIQLKDKVKFPPNANRGNINDLVVEYLKKDYKELFNLKFDE